MSEQWIEHFAWFPVRSTWSKKIIWFKRYHAFEYEFINMKKKCKNRFVYTQAEYLMMILRHEEEIY